MFSNVCGSAGLKSRLAKEAGADPCRQMGDKSKMKAPATRGHARQNQAQNCKFPSNPSTRFPAAYECKSASEPLRCSGCSALIDLSSSCFHVCLSRRKIRKLDLPTRAPLDIWHHRKLATLLSPLCLQAPRRPNGGLQPVSCHGRLPDWQTFR